MNEATDEEVAHAVKQGDKEVYGLLISRYQSKIERYAHKFLADETMITDAVQDVFIKAYMNIQSFDTKKSFSPWIYRIAHNEYVNLLRKKKHISFSFFDFDTFIPHRVAGEDAMDLAIQKDNKRHVEEAIATLEPKYREPLVLFLYEELSYSEIADVLQVPQATVGVRIMRAKKQLATLLHNI